MLFLIVLLLLVIAWLIYSLYQKRQQLKKYQGIMDLEAEQNRVEKEIEALKSQNEELLQQEQSIVDSIATLKAEIAPLEDEVEMRSFGLYESKYDFGSSERFKVEIDRIRQKQKEMIRNANAVISNTEWTVGGNKAKGRTMIKQQVRLMLRAFNGECDSVILKVKYNNIDRIRERIYKVFEAINKLGKSNDCNINPSYLELKIEELLLVHEYQEKKQAELEEQREIRAKIREEQRAQKELEKAKRDAEKEENRYQKALEKARREVELASGEKQQQLNEEIEKLNRLLIEAQENKERAISRAQMTRSGHVYIISNIGSFGENIYKIGMTRRLEPMDRVKELGDASVPFHFDVHAMIFSEDAPQLENTLHRTFDENRVNRVNLRKEYFQVRLDEIEKVVIENHGEIEFTLLAEAEEFRKTQAIISKGSHHQLDG